MRRETLRVTFKEVLESVPNALSGSHYKHILRFHSENDPKSRRCCERDPQKARNLLKVDKLLKESSIHAVKQLGHSSTRFRKFIWLLVMTIGMAGCVYQVNRFLRVYLEYPVVVSLELRQDGLSDFPAVTFCNLNRVMLSSTWCFDSFTSYSSCLQNRFLLLYEKTTTKSCRKQLSGNRSEERNEMKEFLKMYSQMSVDKRIAFGHPLEDFVKTCSYNGVSCSSEDFTLFHNLRYGNCFTFQKPKGMSFLNSGLEITLNINHSQYMGYSRTIGARILVHDASEQPNPEVKGIDISPGYETSIALRKTVIKRLPQPYRDRCFDYKEASNTSSYGKSQIECVRSCIQQHNMDICSCLNPLLLSLKEGRHCDLTNNTEMCCLETVSIELDNRESPCDCPLACKSVYFDEKISLARWPSDVSFFRNNLVTERHHLRNFRKSYAKLRVFYSSTEVKAFHQKPKYEDFEFFSHIGGEFGLWMGLSIVAFFELVEFLVYLGKHVVSKIQQKYF